MYAGGVNLMFLLFMNIYRIYIYMFVFLHPFVMSDKKGEKDLSLYACLFVFMHIYVLCGLGSSHPFSM